MDDKAEGILLSVFWFVIDNYRRVTMKDTIIKLVQGAIMGLGIVAALLFGYHMGGL